MKTLQAIRARRRSLALKSKEELRRIGLHLQAINGGQAVQRLYRQRGITDPCAKARLTRWPAKQAKSAAKVEQEARTRSKVNVGWD